jgi:hypothetical protein
MTRYPFAAPMRASDLPRLPEVDSTMVSPGRSLPLDSACSIMKCAALSLILRPGLAASTLTSTSAPLCTVKFCNRTIGVPPISPSTLSWIAMSPVLPNSSVHDGSRESRLAPRSHRMRLGIFE